MNINLSLNLADFFSFALVLFVSILAVEFVISCVKMLRGSDNKEFFMLPRITEKLPTRLVLSFAASLFICLCGGGIPAVLITGVAFGFLGIVF